MLVDNKTGLSIQQINDRIAGLHFAKESLTEMERDILRLAEALLRMLHTQMQNTQCPFNHC